MRLLALVEEAEGKAARLKQVLKDVALNILFYYPLSRFRESNLEQMQTSKPIELNLSNGQLNLKLIR
jgi:hypothetical protein